MDGILGVHPDEAPESAAASRFIKIVSFANKVSKGQIMLTLEYLYNCFMVEYIGCGMPYEQCNTCALMGWAWRPRST